MEQLTAENERKDRENVIENKFADNIVTTVIINFLRFKALQNLFLKNYSQKALRRGNKKKKLFCDIKK